MANTVTMRFRVLEDGSLQQIANQANQAAAGVDNVSEANARLHRTTRGASNMQGNQTRAFAATANSAGGLVAAYATLMAHTFALTAAFGALQRASALKQLEQGLIAVGNASGISLPIVARQLQEITDGAITTKEAMEATALATSAGFSTVQLKELTKVAKGASLALGRDMGDAMTRLVKGTAKLEPEILDELGIMVRLDEAAQKYADSMEKTVTQLTRFEKQQAFLNATIEQGQKKFSMVFDTVDAEPFAQLSASFRDLVKDITLFINKGAVPLVNFLSNFPTAMVGGLLLFASSITKKLLPALGDLATANSATASIAAASARRAASAVSAEYTAAASRVNSAFRTVPASLRAVETQFRSGSLSVQEYRAHLVTLQRSERSRAAALQASGPNSTSIARQQELDQIRQLIAATQQLIATESRRGVTSNIGARAQSESRSARNQAGIQRRMQGAGVRESFGLASTGARIQFKEVKRATGALNKMRAGLTAASRSAALFGSALLNSVPVIGQILFFGSMLLPLFGDLFTKSNLQKKADEAAESFLNFDRIVIQLIEHLEGLDSAEEKFASTLAVRIGVIGTLESGLKGLFEGKSKDNSEKEAEAMKKLVDVTKERGLVQDIINDGQEKYNRMEFGGLKEYDAVQFLVKIKKEEVNAQKALNAVRNDSNTLSKRAILNQINMFRGQLKATGQTALFSKELVKLAAIEKKLLTGDMSEMLGSDTLFEEIENLTQPLTALEQAQRGLEEATLKVENGLVKAAEKAKGEFGDLFTELTDIENNLRVISDSAASTGDAMSDVAPSANTIKQIERLQRALGVDDVIIKGQKNYLKTMEKVTQQVAANNRLLAENAEKRKNTLAIAKELSSLSGKNEAAEKARLRLVSEANKLELERLQTLETNLIAQVGEEGVTDKLLQTRQKIKGVQSDISAESENGFRIAQAGVKEKQQLLNLLTEETKLRQKIVGIENSRAKRDLELERAKTGDGLTKRDEINLAKKAQKELKANSDKLLKQEKAAINLKFDLMALGFKLEKMKIARLLKEKKIGNDEAKQMTATIDNALTAIGTAGTQSMVSTGIDPVTGIPGSTVTGGTPSTGVRGAALDAADAASADKEDQADAKIKRLKIELERESKRKLASDLGGITGTGMMARMDNEDATARLNKTLADNEQVVKDGGEGMSDEELFQAKMDAAKTYAANFSKVTAGIAADMRSIGPEGELMAATLEAVSSTVETAIAAVAVMGSETASMAEKVGAGLAVAGSIVQGMAAMNKASSDAKIRGIDDEIAAEKARDGQSAASAGKIKALEAKKTAVARKAFEDEKKMKIAQTIISTAQGAIAAYTSLADDSYCRSSTWCGRGSYGCLYGCESSLQ